MNYIEAPTAYTGIGPSLFLAGGITGTQDWQALMTQMLADTTWTILNPRRQVYLQNSAAGVEQIRWEFHHLRCATARLFWFPAETLCPIALFELGAWSRTREALFVGVHPDYQRRFDVHTQLALARPDITVAGSLDELAAQAAGYLRQFARKEIAA